MEIKCSYSELKDPGLLTPNPRNPNKHGDRQIELLAKIINHTGFRHPIVVSKRSGFIVAGHGRLQAANKLGLSEVPVDYQDFNNEAEEFEFLIADNKIAELAEHDDSMMIDGIKELDLSDLELLGLDNFEIPLEADPAKDETEDDVPDNVDTRAKPGDLWILGEHRLLCGDSTNVQHVEKLMGGAKADMVFTDPPYGVNAVSGSKAFGTVGGHNIIKANVYKKIRGDDSTDTAKDSFALSKEFSRTQIFWGAQCYAENLPPSQGWIVWDKDTTGNYGDGELAWTNQDRAVRIFKHTWNGLVKASERREKRVHPTQKPIALAEWCFENYGKPKTVLDLFGGSGSTLIACEKTARQCYMMEIDPHYCDVILLRWEQYSGKASCMAKLDFSHDIHLFDPISVEYIKCVLAGADGKELYNRFGGDLFKLEANKQIEKFIYNLKLNRKLRKDLADRAHTEEYVKLIPSAIKIINNSMAPDNTVSARQFQSAKFVPSPLNAYLRRLFENVADAELGVVDG